MAPGAQDRRSGDMTHLCAHPVCAICAWDRWQRERQGRAEGLDWRLWVQEIARQKYNDAIRRN